MMIPMTSDETMARDDVIVVEKRHDKHLRVLADALV